MAWGGLVGASVLFLAVLAVAHGADTPMPPRRAADTAVDQAALLLRFKAAVTADPHHVLAGWSAATTADVCTWRGVTCGRGANDNTTEVVVSLALPYRALEGTLPPELGQLTTLRTLALDSNVLRGTIPREFGQLRALTELSLASNVLEGTLPPELGQLRALERVDMSGNVLAGPLPAQLGALTALSWMDVSANRLTGTLPHALGQLTRMEWLYLSNNFFSGTLPTCVFAPLTRLLGLSVAANELVGTIPDALVRPLRALTSIELQSNHFVGTVPRALSMLPALEWIDLHENKLQGTVPRELGHLASLDTLDLGHNQLHGTIPGALADATALRTLVLRGNKLEGSMPHELFSLAHLSVLDLSANELSGSLSPRIARLRALTALEMFDNMLTGSIPRELGELTLLTSLDLHDNRLTGSIPAELGRLVGLSTLSLAGNALTGAIPSALGALARVSVLNLGHNALTGQIPRSLAECGELTLLSVSANRLDGTIPRELFRTWRLMRTLSVAGNRLHGTIPAELGQLVPLERLDLSNNPRISGAVPDEIGLLASLTVLSLSATGISHLPHTIANLTALEQLYVSDTALHELPDVFGAMRSLERVEVSSNGMLPRLPPSLGAAPALEVLIAYDGVLTGSIPAWLRHATALRVLGLSDNRLTGVLQAWLGEMPALEELHVHGNALHGEVPAALADARALRVVTLGSNALEGTLPTALAQMANLTHFDCSNNALRGALPFAYGEPATLVSLRAAENHFSSLEESLLQFRGPLTACVVAGNAELLLHWDSMTSGVDIGVVGSSTAQVTTRGSALTTFDVSGTGIRGDVNTIRVDTGAKMGLASLPDVSIVNLSNTRSSGDVGALSDSVQTLDISYSDVTGVVITNNLRTLRMSNMSSFEGVPRVTQQRAAALEFFDARSARLKGDASFLRDAHRLMYFYATDNPLFRNSSAAVVYTRADHARVENRGLPRFLRFSTNYAQVRDNFSCPLLRRAGEGWIVQVAQLDPSYYGYSACMCAAGMYGVPPVCIPCPPGAVCDEGSTTPLALDGYWGEEVACEHGDAHCVLWDDCDHACTRRNGSRLAFYPCVNLGGGKSACHSLLSSPDDDVHSAHAFFDIVLTDGEVNECADGYEEDSRVCTRCEDGWFKSGTACKPCVDGSVVLLPLALVLGIALLYAVAFVAAQRDHAAATTPRRATLSILILHMQLLGLMKQLGTPLPDLLRGESESSAVALFTVPAPECVVNGAHFEGRLLVAVLTPPVLVLVSALIFTAGRACLSVARRATWLDVNIGVLVQMLTFAYMPVCVHAFQALPCEDFGGRSFMLHAPDVPCGSAAHRRMVGVASVSIVVFVLGGPLFIMWRVWLHRSAQPRDDSPFARRYGMLVRVFRDGMWFWKGVFYLRAILVTLCLAVFSPRSPALGSAVYLVLALFLWLQNHFAPFRDGRDNANQFTSLVLSLLSFYAVSQFFAHGTSGRGALAVDVIVALLNTALVGVLALGVAAQYAKHGHRFAQWLATSTARRPTKVEMSSGGGEGEYRAMG